MPEPTNPPTLADLQAALSAMFSIAWVDPQLPAPYLTISTGPSEISMLISDAAAFETWRKALRVDPHTVVLNGHSGSAWLKAVGTLNKVSFEIFTHDVPLTEEQANTPQDAEPTAAVLV